MAIVDLEDETESINALVYGDSGIGKTVLAGTASDSLLLATETGYISAARSGSKAKLWKINRWDDIVEAYTYLNNNAHPFKWVVIDSLTEMQKLSMDKALATGVALNSNRDPDIPAIQDYQKNQNQTLNMVRRFNDLPVNVLYTALPQRIEDEDGEVTYLPLLTGKNGGVAQQTCGYMHMVGAYVVRTIPDPDREGKTKRVRRLLLQKSDKWFAKDRYSIGKFMDNPTIPKIEALITVGDAPATSEKPEEA